MEVNPGIPESHFDLVFSIYGMGWTTDLPATMALVAKYLRPGGSFILSGEHPAYSCVEWNGTQVRHHQAVFNRRASGACLVERRSDRRPHRTLSTFVAARSGGLGLEALIEGEIDLGGADESHVDPARWYSIDRARLIPTTFVIKARKP